MKLTNSCYKTLIKSLIGFLKDFFLLKMKGLSDFLENIFLKKRDL